MAISHCYWHLVVKNGNFTLLLTSSGQEWQWEFHIAYWHLVVARSGQEWQFDNCYWHLVVRMAISHCYWHLVLKNGNFILLLTSSSSQEWQCHIATWHLVVQNGNFTLLLTSSGQEWQFHIAMKCSGQVMAISHELTSSGQNWQFHMSTYI